jgi:acyl transferase domain-containing protein
VQKNEVEYIEAHGTGTELGDTIEIEALREVFSSEVSQKGLGDENAGRTYPILIGSVKANLGHTEVVSGLTGVLKVILQYRYNKIAPSGYTGGKQISSLLSCSSIKLCTDTTDWSTSRSTSGRRIAGVNSIGLGGVNAHAVLSGYDDDGQRTNGRLDEAAAKSRIFLFSERTNSYLVEYLQEFIQYLKDSASSDMDAIASTLAFGRAHRGERLVCIAETKDELVERLESYILEVLEAQAGQADMCANVDKPRLNGQSRILSGAIGERLLHMCEEWVTGNSADASHLVTERSRRTPIPGRRLAKTRCWINDGEPIHRRDRSRTERIQGSDYYKWLNETSWYGENHGF